MFRLTLVFLVLTLTSCATYRFVPVETPGITVSRDRDKTLSTLETAAVRVAVDAFRHDSNAAFNVTVTNRLDHPIRLRDVDFQISESLDGLTWTRLRTIPSDESFAPYRDEVQVSPGVAVLAIAGILAVAAIDASVQKTDEQRRQEKLDREAQERRDRQAAEDRKAEKEFLRTHLFFETTLEPGATYSGFVQASNKVSGFFRLELKTIDIEGVVFQYHYVSSRVR